MKAIKFLFSPPIFGLGFMAPLIAELIVLAEFNLPSGVPLIAGLIIGGSLGLMAQARGSWVWLPWCSTSVLGHTKSFNRPHASSQR